MQAVMQKNAGVESNAPTTQGAKKKFWRKQNKDRIFISLMLLWPIAHFLVFWLYMNFDSLLMTFRHVNVTTGLNEWYGFRRYADIINHIFGSESRANPMFRNGLLNSLTVFPVNNLIILPLSFVCAYFMFKRVPMANLFRVIFFLPSIVSIVVLTMSFRYMFNTEFGPFSNIINTIFGVRPDYFSAMSPTAMPMVFLFCVWAGLGYNVILIGGAMARVPAEIIEYGKLDGVGKAREMFQIMLPLTWPTISTLIVLNALAVFGFWLQPMLLTGDGSFEGRTSTIGLLVVDIIKASNADVADAAALGILFSAAGIPFILLLRWILSKISADVEF
ncbi:hypothetical protein FACS1894211_03660 [Clostridia bacterium]|nr:hypothetical protein FACS1894211_03660 [Clostridia bacterium]